METARMNKRKPKWHKRRQNKQLKSLIIDSQLMKQTNKIDSMANTLSINFKKSFAFSATSYLISNYLTVFKLLGIDKKLIEILKYVVLPPKIFQGLVHSLPYARIVSLQSLYEGQSPQYGHQAQTVIPEWNDEIMRKDPINPHFLSGYIQFKQEQKMNKIQMIIEMNNQFQPDWLLAINKNLTALELIQVIDRTPCQNICMLYLQDNKIGDMGIKYIMEKKWPSIHKMMLSGNQITDLGIQYLVSGQWKNMELLTWVWLDNNQITDQGVKIFAANTYVEESEDYNQDNILNLNFGDNKITDKGVEYFVSHNIMNHIYKLGLENTQITDKGMELIFQTEWPQLRQLFFSNNQISEKMKARIPEVQKKFEEKGQYVYINVSGTD